MNPRMKMNMQGMMGKAQKAVPKLKPAMMALKKSLPKTNMVKSVTQSFATGKSLAKPMGMGAGMKKRLGGAANRLMSRNYSR